MMIAAVVFGIVAYAFAGGVVRGLFVYLLGDDEQEDAGSHVLQVLLWPLLFVFLVLYIAAEVLPRWIGRVDR